MDPIMGNVVSGRARDQILERKRREYRDLVPEYYDIEAAERSEDDNSALRQVLHPQPVIRYNRNKGYINRIRG